MKNETKFQQIYLFKEFRMYTYFPNVYKKIFKKRNTSLLPMEVKEVE